MQETTIIIKTPITLDVIKRVVEIEKQITEAVQLFGYDLEKHRLTIKPCVFHRYKVYMDDKYFGMWDIRRRTFID